MQDVLSSVPYNQAGWEGSTFLPEPTPGLVDGYAVLIESLRSRRCPWGIFQKVLRDRFALTPSEQGWEPAQRAGPETFQDRIHRNYLLLKQIQKQNLQNAPYQSASAAAHTLAVTLHPQEQPFVLSIFLALVHTALDAQTSREPADTPPLAFVVSSGYLDRLYAVAHWMDLFNTKIPFCVFEQMVNLVEFCRKQGDPTKKVTLAGVGHRPRSTTTSSVAGTYSSSRPSTGCYNPDGTMRRRLRASLAVMGNIDVASLLGSMDDSQAAVVASLYMLDDNNKKKLPLQVQQELQSRIPRATITRASLTHHGSLQTPARVDVALGLRFNVDDMLTEVKPKWDGLGEREREEWKKQLQPLLAIVARDRRPEFDDLRKFLHDTVFPRPRSDDDVGFWEAFLAIQPTEMENYMAAIATMIHPSQDLHEDVKKKIEDHLTFLRSRDSPPPPSSEEDQKWLKEQVLENDAWWTQRSHDMDRWAQHDTEDPVEAIQSIQKLIKDIRMLAGGALSAYVQAFVRDLENLVENIQTDMQDKMTAVGQLVVVPPAQWKRLARGGSMQRVYIQLLNHEANRQYLSEPDQKVLKTFLEIKRPHAPLPDSLAMKFVTAAVKAMQDPHNDVNIETCLTRVVEHINQHPDKKDEAPVRYLLDVWTTLQDSGVDATSVFRGSLCTALAETWTRHLTAFRFHEWVVRVPPNMPGWQALPFVWRIITHPGMARHTLPHVVDEACLHLQGNHQSKRVLNDLPPQVFGELLSHFQQTVFRDDQYQNSVLQALRDHMIHHPMDLVGWKVLELLKDEVVDSESWVDGFADILGNQGTFALAAGPGYDGNPQERQSCYGDLVLVGLLLHPTLQVIERIYPRKDLQTIWDQKRRCVDPAPASMPTAEEQAKRDHLMQQAFDAIALDTNPTEEGWKWLVEVMQYVDKSSPKTKDKMRKGVERIRSAHLSRMLANNASPTFEQDRQEALQKVLNYRRWIPNGDLFLDQLTDHLKVLQRFLERMLDVAGLDKEVARQDMAQMRTTRRTIRKDANQRSFNIIQHRLTHETNADQKTLDKADLERLTKKVHEPAKDGDPIVIPSPPVTYKEMRSQMFTYLQLWIQHLSAVDEEWFFQLAYQKPNKAATDMLNLLLQLDVDKRKELFDSTWKGIAVPYGKADQLTGQDAPRLPKEQDPVSGIDFDTLDHDPGLGSTCTRRKTGGPPPAPALMDGLAELLAYKAEDDTEDARADNNLYRQVLACVETIAMVISAVRPKLIPIVYQIMGHRAKREQRYEDSWKFLELPADKQAAFYQAWREEHTRARTDGKHAWNEDNDPLPDGQTRPCVAILSDITEFMTLAQVAEDDNVDYMAHAYKFVTHLMDPSHRSSDPYYSTLRDNRTLSGPLKQAILRFDALARIHAAKGKTPQLLMENQTVINFLPRLKYPVRFGGVLGAYEPDANCFGKKLQGLGNNVS